MMEYSFNLHEVAASLEKAITRAISEGCRTADIMQKGMKQVGCVEMGSIVAGYI